MLIRDFGDCEENNTKDGCNRGMPLALTILRISFRSAVKGQPLFKKICLKMGLDGNYETGYCAALQKMIDLAAVNGSDAADKLVKKLHFTQELNERFQNLGALDRIRAAKKGEIIYPG